MRRVEDASENARLGGRSGGLNHHFPSVPERNGTHYPPQECQRANGLGGGTGTGPKCKFKLFAPVFYPINASSLSQTNKLSYQQYCSKKPHGTSLHVCIHPTVDAAYRPVYVHGVHISEAGSNLHPVLVDPQQVFFHKVHGETSAGNTGHIYYFTRT